MNVQNLERTLKSTVAALALGSLMAFQLSAAQADDTAEEIRLLKARLKQLEEKVAKQDKERKAAEAAAAAAGPMVSQKKNYGIPKIPGSSEPEVAYFGFGTPVPAPSYQGGGLVGLEEKLGGHPYVGPSTLFINGVSITPGGFFELASVTRSHFMGADLATPFGNIPFANIPSSNTNEFHFSARRSRAAALVRGDVSETTHLSGYGEFDWLGAAQTANLNQTDSFNLRIRHLYLAVDDDYWGVHMLAGHAFTLATMDIQGILPRKENTPLTIEDQYVPGFLWDRQDQIRIVKDFDQKFWVALSAEQPATTFGGSAPTTPVPISVLNGVTYTPPTGTTEGTIVGGSLYNNLNSLSLNQMPDLIGKVAWDPDVFDRTIHMEAFGIFRNFEDRTVFNPSSGPYVINGALITNHNNNTTGGGVGGSILVPVIAKVLEAQFSGVTGYGIGRYGASQLADVTYNANGSLSAIKEYMLLAGLVYHPWTGLDIYAYAGEESEKPDYGWTPYGGFIGLGNPAYNNSGCTIELSTVCSGNLQKVEAITGGFWQDLYKGPFGRLTGGLEYMFAKKFAFEGFGYSPSIPYSAPGAGFTPTRVENMFYTSLRFYPF